MTMKIARNPSFWLAALASATALLAAVAATAGDPTPPPDPPSGQLLIASAAIQDPRFQRSVILLLHHDRGGAMGIIINHPLGEQKLAELLDGAGGKDAAIAGTIRVLFGGPVQPQSGFVVHSAEYHRKETLAVADALAVTATKDVLRDIGHHRGPAKYLFALGYSGWGAGQLEAEIARRDWFIEPATPDLVFDAERSTLWQKALSARDREL
jgi:putative transcriptional regulator